MPRCEDGSAFLDGANDGEGAGEVSEQRPYAWQVGAWPVDPDFLGDTLDEVGFPGMYDPANDSRRMSPWQRAAFACLWPLLVRIDPEEQEKDRRRMMTYLGRYGRQSVRDEDWAETDLEEFKAKFQDLADVIARESAVGRKAEDDG